MATPPRNSVSKMSPPRVIVPHRHTAQTMPVNASSAGFSRSQSTFGSSARATPGAMTGSIGSERRPSGPVHTPSRTRVTHRPEMNVANTPMAIVTPKPFTSVPANSTSTRQTIRLVMLPSKIALKARANPIRMPLRRVSPLLTSSSRMRS